MKKEQIHFFSWDERRDIAHPGNKEASVVFAVEHFINCAKEALADHGFFAVALSGGSTPKAIFETLSKDPYPSEIDWTKVLVFWSDERSVKPTDTESNFKMAFTAGLKKLSIPSNQIFRMQAESDIEENAKTYEKNIRKMLKGRPFDLIMLGMGEDGHTASLFPGTQALEETEKLVVANHVPQQKTMRMTLTYPCINEALNIVIYVLGKNKEEMVNKVFLETHSPPFPISLVGTKTNKALFVLDSDAGKKIFPKQKH